MSAAAGVQMLRHEHMLDSQSLQENSLLPRRLKSAQPDLHGTCRSLWQRQASDPLQGPPQATAL